MRTMMTIFLMSLLTSLSYAGDKGNGGGGIREGDEVMTFYSSEIPVEHNERTMAEVPMLQETINFFYKSNYFTDSLIYELIGALSPDLGRKYYNIKSGDLSENRYNEIIEEYARVKKINTSKIAIFAVTDVYTRTTFLFPEFYLLDPVEQMAILFHEAMWIIYPNESLEKIMYAEATFQAYLEDQTPEKLVRLAAILPQKRIHGEILDQNIYFAAIQSDLSRGVLNKFAPNGKVMLKKFLGEKLLKCLKQSAKNRYGNIDFYVMSDCEVPWRMRIIELQSLYPASIFFKYIGRPGFMKSHRTDRHKKLTIEDLDNAMLTLYSPDNGVFTQSDNLTGDVLLVD